MRLTLANGEPPAATTDTVLLRLANLVAFQIGWWAVVLTAANGIPALGVGVVAILLVWHLTRVRPRGSEALLVILAAAIGLTFESLMQGSGWVEFAGGPGGMVAPLWLAALWANFAITLNISLQPLHGRHWLAAGLGGIGGPVAYVAGAELGAMTFIDAPAALAALTLVWAMLTPLLLSVAAALSGRPRT